MSGKKGAKHKKQLVRVSLADRFWARVDKGPGHGPNGDCWIWTGALDNHGYGRCGVQRDWELRRKGWRSVQTHRLVMEFEHGFPLPAEVMHKCDNPPCVNPAHLEFGTQKDNMKDMAAKSRSPKGGSHWSRREPGKVARGESKSALREVDVRSMHRLREKGETHEAIADRFGISRQQVSKILSGQRWGHVKKNS